MSQLDDIRARIPNIPEADMSRSEKDRAYLLARIDAVQAVIDEFNVDVAGMRTLVEVGPVAYEAIGKTQRAINASLARNDEDRGAA